MVRLHRRRVHKLTIGLLVVLFFLPCFQPWGWSDGVVGVEKTTRSGPPELRRSLRDAIPAAIDNNVNVRLLKKGAPKVLGLNPSPSPHA